MRARQVIDQALASQTGQREQQLTVEHASVVRPGGVEYEGTVREQPRPDLVDAALPDQRA